MEHLEQGVSLEKLVTKEIKKLSLSSYSKRVFILLVLIFDIHTLIASTFETDEIEETQQEENYLLLKQLKSLPEYPSDSEIIKFSNRESTISMMDNYLNSIMTTMPESSLKEGIKKYLEIINPQLYRGSDEQVATGNSGLSQYFSHQLISNPCLGAITHQFYTEIKQRDQLNLKRHLPLIKTHPLLGRASLADETGVGHLQDYKAGWLFERALKYTKNDPNLAIELISICGHDDINQGEYSFVNHQGVNTDQYNVEKYLQTLDEEIQKYEFEYGQLSENFISRKDALKRYIEALKKFKQDLAQSKVNSFNALLDSTKLEEISCPKSGSIFYGPKSLGAEFDLTPEEKERIHRIQAPTKGPSHLPSKSYHIYGAAFMTCSLIEKGVSPKLAKIIQEMAAWGYRTIRISQKIKEDLEYYNQHIKEHYNRFRQEYTAPKGKLISGNRGTRREATPQTAPSEAQWLLMISQGDIEKPFDIHLPTLASIEDAKKFLLDYDAARYLDHFTLGGSGRLPHTNIHINYYGDPIDNHLRKQDQMARPNHLNKERYTAGNFGWSKERYQNAKEKALTYLADWDWTVSQHRIGAQFAAKNCKEKPHDFVADDILCEQTKREISANCNSSQLGAIRTENKQSIQTIDSTIQDQLLQPEIRYHGGKLILENIY